MNALTLFSLAVAIAGCTSSLAHPGVYGAYPGLYPGIVPHGYRGFDPAASHVPVAHGPLTYNHLGHPGYIAGYNTIPYAPIQSQFHAPDELGQYSFGYSGGPSARSESRDAFGNVRGSYNYIDSEGKVQTQHYVADALGFRVSGTNLPVAPDAPEAAPLALAGPLPEPVTDTPEVVAAKAAHQAAYDEAAAAAEAAPDRKKRSLVTAPFLSAYSPLRFSYGFSAPLTYGHPSFYGLHHTLSPYAHSTHAYNHAPYTYAAPYTAVPSVTVEEEEDAATPSDTKLLRVVNSPKHAVSYSLY
ncbi:cuticle protein 18.6-like [Palaemon carinicauda]|uniref:cuticle protein 18.6-like n=1 Tax=Palaemon carinicauda TaxID=392227 RepID=UPI0035B5A838